MPSEYVWKQETDSHDEWIKKFQYLKHLYETTGSCEVRGDLWIHNVGAVGQWANDQRDAMRKGSLSEEEVTLLREIHFRFEADEELEWNDRYRQLSDYKRRYNSIDIVPSNVEKAGHLKSLKLWVEKQKEAELAGKLSREKYRLLAELGVFPEISGISHVWLKRYKMAVSFYEKNNHLRISKPYYTDDGYDLGHWIYRMRKNKSKLSKEQIRLLDEIGMVWDSNQNQRWEDGFSHLIAFVKEYGHTRVPRKYRSDDDYHLSQWCITQAQKYGKGFLTDEHKKCLDSVGFDPEFHIRKSDRKKEWLEKYRKIKKTMAENPEHLDISMIKWIKREQRIVDGKINVKRTKSQLDMLAEIGIVPNKKSFYKDKWQKHFEETAVFLNENGILPKRAVNLPLYAWVRNQYKKLEENKLSSEQIELLKSIGIIKKEKK